MLIEYFPFSVVLRLPAPVAANLTSEEEVRAPPAIDAVPLMVELKLVAAQLVPPVPVQ